MKKCIVCNINKNLDEFYNHKGMKDGKLNKCKSCCKSQENSRQIYNQNNPEWVIKEKNRHREKYHSLNYKDKYPYKPSDSNQKYYDKYPEKKIAKTKAHRLKKEKGTHLHHWSYLPEHTKDVITLKVKDHYTSHRFIIYDQERMMYRTQSGELLDSKIRHLEYITQYL